jgi:hypothetical protein
VLTDVPASAYGMDAFGGGYDAYGDVYYAEDGTAFQVPAGDGDGQLGDAGGYTAEEYQAFEDQQPQ